MDVSVIIVNYNTYEMTIECIDSIVRNTQGVSYEIIVVDNASTDGSQKHLLIDKRIKFVTSTVNLGFGRANNLGYTYSSGKYLFLLNSDTIVLNNAIKLFYDKMESLESSIACMGCLLIGKDGSDTHSYGEFPTLKKELIRGPFHFLSRLPFVEDGFDGFPKQRIDSHCFLTEYVTGADLFIRRSVVDKYGLFDEEFFMYYEDTEMQFRYHKHGYFSCILNTPRIIHLGGGSQSKQSPWKGTGLRGLFLCYKKIHGDRPYYILKCLMFLTLFPKCLFDWRYPIKERFSYIKKLIEA